MLKFGIDRPLEIKKATSGARIGLVCSAASLGTDLLSSIEKLSEVVALFAPEHGIRGELPAGTTLEDYTDQYTKLPVYSLYSSTGKHLRPETVKNIDMLIYDIPDVGCRFYTYISTLLRCMQTCAQQNIPLLVLDRPNPLGGLVVEGNLLQKSFSSFIGCWPMPIRYGLTSGEFAQMVNQERNIGCDLRIIQCSGWKRESLFPLMKTPWIPPSLNLPSFESALCYPGSCLFEGTNLSEGRGTTFPFQITGAPFIDPIRLAYTMNDKGLVGVQFIPVWFTPSSSKYTGELCAGVRWCITNPILFRPVATGVNLLFCIKKMYPDNFHFLPPRNEHTFMDLLAGSKDFTKKNADTNKILAMYEEDSLRFLSFKKQFHLYT